MANDSCGPEPASQEPVQPGTRMVHCVKFDKELPGLDRIPWKGELGHSLERRAGKARLRKCFERGLEDVARALQDDHE